MSGDVYDEIKAETEEIGEVAREFNDARHDARPVDRQRLRKELIQTAAMATAWADRIGAGQPMSGEPEHDEPEPIARPSDEQPGGDPATMVGQVVRVFAMAGGGVLAEGRIVGYQPRPTYAIRKADGGLASVSVEARLAWRATYFADDAADPDEQHPTTRWADGAGGCWYRVERHEVIA